MPPPTKEAPHFAAPTSGNELASFMGGHSQSSAVSSMTIDGE